MDEKIEPGLASSIPATHTRDEAAIAGANHGGTAHEAQVAEDIRRVKNALAEVPADQPEATTWPWT